MAQRTCSIEGCERPNYGRGWCRNHYARWVRTGLPTGSSCKSLADRFAPRVDRNGPLIREELGRCWNFLGAHGPTGYGSFYVAPRMINAHRVAWEVENGPVPDDLHVLHKCDNPGCVNPEHLFLGTHLDNIADMYAKGRGVNQKKTHCIHGHPFTVANTYIAPGSTKRACRACRVDIDRRYKARH